MCLNPVISSDIHRSGFEFSFHDSEVLLDFPALLVNLYDFLDISLKICHYCVEAIVKFFFGYLFHVNFIYFLFCNLTIVCSADFIDIRTLDETDEDVFHSIYYKEVPVVTGDLDETLIVTYSPKYKAYQQRIRSRQIERAERIISSPCKKRKGKNQNDPMRFVKKTAVTGDGEIAEKKVYELDEEQIAKEELCAP